MDYHRPGLPVFIQAVHKRLQEMPPELELVVEVQATREVIVELLNVFEFHSALDVVENTRCVFLFLLFMVWCSCFFVLGCVWLLRCVQTLVT